MEQQIKRNFLLPIDMKIREAGEGEGESRIIEGYACKFGVRSQLLNDYWELYYEEIAQGAITEELLRECDFVLTLYHDPHKILGRSKPGGEGTLHWEIDAIGVKFWAEMPRTQWGDEALELVRRGDVDGCSFIYSTDEQDKECVSYTTEKVNDDIEVLVRTVHKIKRIYDMTLTYRPAYKQTECNARERELLEGMKGAKDTPDTESEEEKKARELAEAEARKAREAKRDEILSRHKTNHLFTI